MYGTHICIAMAFMYVRFLSEMSVEHLMAYLSPLFASSDRVVGDFCRTPGRIRHEIKLSHLSETLKAWIYVIWLKLTI